MLTPYSGVMDPCNVARVATLKIQEMRQDALVIVDSSSGSLELSVFQSLSGHHVTYIVSLLVLVKSVILILVCCAVCMP